MTKTITTSYATLLCLALLLTAGVTVHASEVTGTLSSDNTNTVPTGNIGGTVESVSTESSGGGSSSGGSRRSGLSNAQPGAVLGATTNSAAAAPGFPNAGSQPEEAPTPWSELVYFFQNLFSF